MKYLITDNLLFYIHHLYVIFGKIRIFYSVHRTLHRTIYITGDRTLYKTRPNNRRQAGVSLSLIEFVFQSKSAGVTRAARLMSAKSTGTTPHHFNEQHCFKQSDPLYLSVSLRVYVCPLVCLPVCLSESVDGSSPGTCSPTSRVTASNRDVKKVHLLLCLTTCLCDNLSLEQHVSLTLWVPIC